MVIVQKMLIPDVKRARHIMVIADDKYAKARAKSLEATADWGTQHRPAHEILLHALTGRPIRITQKVKTDNGESTITLTKEMEAANDKMNRMRQEFQAWVWRDSERSSRLVSIYNDTFNTTVPRKFDGSFLTLPGSSNLIQVYDHVKRGAWRIVQTGNTYLAHAVGSGKTWASVISIMEQRRLGLVSKPMVVVPNHMLQQFAAEWLQLYPAARIMVADEANFTGENRRRFVSRVALSDLDGVIITHDAFKRLDLDPEFKAKIIEEELDLLRASLEEAQRLTTESVPRSAHVRPL
jgi:N12 class adenine-specific DNA methylase